MGVWLYTRKVLAPRNIYYQSLALLRNSLFGYSMRENGKNHCIERRCWISWILLGRFNDIPFTSKLLGVTTATTIKSVVGNFDLFPWKLLFYYFFENFLSLIIHFFGKNESRIFVSKNNVKHPGYFRECLLVSLSSRDS